MTPPIGKAADEQALRVQNGALRTLNAHLEAEIATHRARAQEYHAAIATLDSERAANALLTAEVEALRAVVAAVDRHEGWTEAGHKWLDAGAPVPLRSRAVECINEEKEVG